MSFINLSNILNFFIFKPISAAGNIPASDKTEYRPPIKSLCSIISAFNLLAILTIELFLISVIKTNLFLSEKLESRIFKLVIDSMVSPDLEIIIKQLFFNFFNFLNSKYKFSSKLSKKNTSFFTLFLKKL